MDSWLVPAPYISPVRTRRAVKGYAHYSPSPQTCQRVARVANLPQVWSLLAQSRPLLSWKVTESTCGRFSGPGYLLTSNMSYAILLSRLLA